MSTDISEEAKLAIANGHLVRARQRLVRDGCRTDAAMRRRLLVLAAERNLPPAEYAKLMHKRIMIKSIQEFCRKHNVSLDWLMDGDLKGLQRMKQWAKEDHGMTAVSPELLKAQLREFLRVLLCIDKDKLPTVMRVVRTFVEGGGNTSA